MDPLRFFSAYGPHTSYRILLLFAAVYCRLAMEAARKLGVEPVITAREMADPEVDHLGVMAYVARLRSVAPAAVESVHPRSGVSPPPPLPPLRSPSVNHSPPSDSKPQFPDRRQPASLPPLVQRLQVQSRSSSGYVGQTV